MGTRDKRVDAYIAKYADFARPILAHIRDVVHEGCPDVEETIEWGFPNFQSGRSDEAMGQFGRIAKLSELPADVLAALEKTKKAQAAFDRFPPSHKREYVEWIVGAKADETRQRRIARTIEWVAEGKPRNWKYT